MVGGGAAVGVVALLATVGAAAAEWAPLVDADDPATCQLSDDAIISGGPPKDGIPSVDRPLFSTSYSRSSSDKVLGVVVEGVAKAYPLPLLDWHEIVNDKFEDDDVPVAVTYCPLAASGLVFDTTSMESTELGTSGSLYENNLVMYDRATDSQWSQMLNQAVNGPSVCRGLELLPVTEISLYGWLKLYPDSLIQTYDTGYSRSYGTYPYGDFYTSDEILFVTSYDTSQKPYNLYHPKALTQVLWFEGETYLYPNAAVAEHGVVNGPHDVVIMHHAQYGTSIPFFAGGRKFEATGDVDADNFITMRDVETGSVWNAHGLAISGDLAGTQLPRAPGYSAFWYSATSLMPTAKVCRSADCTAGVGGRENVEQFDPVVETWTPWRWWMSAAVVLAIPVGLWLLWKLYMCGRRESEERRKEAHQARVRAARAKGTEEGVDV